jgi:hypothetical protein
MHSNDATSAPRFPLLMLSSELGLSRAYFVVRDTDFAPSFIGQLNNAVHCDITKTTPKYICCLFRHSAVPLLRFPFPTNLRPTNFPQLRPLPQISKIEQHFLKI